MDKLHNLCVAASVAGFNNKYLTPREVRRSIFIWVVVLDTARHTVSVQEVISAIIQQQQKMEFRSGVRLRI